MNTNQPNQITTPPTPNTQPINPPPATQTPPQLAPKKKKPWLLISFIVLLLSATGVLGYKYYELRQQVIPTPVPSPELVVSSPLPVASPESKKSEIISIDNTWNKYINYSKGYSIYIPKETMDGYGSCEWSEKDGDHSYRPKADKVPVQTIEDNNRVFISGEYYYKLAGETKESAGVGTRSFYSECNKTPINLANLKQGNTLMYWELVSGSVSNDIELEQFIQNEYGSECKLGEKKASVQEKVFDIIIDQGDWNDSEQARQRGCNVNYAYEIKYLPDSNKVISWKLGQAHTFWKDSYNPLDETMVKSFQFLNP